MPIDTQRLDKLESRIEVIEPMVSRAVKYVRGARRDIRTLKNQAITTPKLWKLIGGSLVVLQVLEVVLHCLAMTNTHGSH